MTDNQASALESIEEVLAAGGGSNGIEQAREKAERESWSLPVSPGVRLRCTAGTGGELWGYPDISGLPGIHIECKRAEQLRPYDWMAQAERDAVRFGDGLPAVFFRRSRSPWLVVMKLEDWLKIYRTQSEPRKTAPSE